MPSVERETSRDSERRLNHQHSASFDHTRAIIPMWDSSDPERAPPPLPLNPSSPSVTSRVNTSSAIKSAHAALTEKARENAYITNPSPTRNDISPERSFIKGAAHKRMQSLQTGHVRDLSSFLEGGNAPVSPTRSPVKSANHPVTPYTIKEFSPESNSPEKSTARSVTPTPQGKDTPTLRPSLRRPPQGILGENTPPQSATMLALHSMPSREMETPLSIVTNGSTALVRTPQTFDAISTQILSLTSIATSLQREMAQLSRRSKDNATDLVSLKEATNARDEDIRKSLRELVSNLSETNSRSSSNLYGNGAYLLDNKPHGSLAKGIKTVSLPRIPSPSSFSSSLDRELAGSPMPYAQDGAATIALLEKVLREMGTKEGQEMLVVRLSEVAELLTRDGMSTAKKVDDLVRFIKDNSGGRALLVNSSNGNGSSRPRNFSFEEAPRLELDFDSPRPGPMVSRVENLLASTGANKENQQMSGSTRAAEVVNEDILKIIRNVKDSVAQGGGLTAEVKALVRELRGEVLGMGREIGRKLEESGEKSLNAQEAAADNDHLAQIIQDGLEELKNHMDRVMREARRQSSSSVSHALDGQEVYNAVRSAMVEMQATRPATDGTTLDKEDIIEAVREAWENYKPEIELQHFGLEREEILTCLKEGLQEHMPHDNSREVGGATRDEVFTAVVEGMKHFSPPRVETEASLSREEILDAVRECLEEFEFPSAPSDPPRENEITKDDMLDAVKEGLSSFDFPTPDIEAIAQHVGSGVNPEDVFDAVRDAVKEGLSSFDFPVPDAGAITPHVGSGVNREDVFDAVRDAMEGMPAPTDSQVEQLMERLEDVIQSMRQEFKAVSDEAKENVSAHGRDTEQVLDATKDGFEKLRSDIETYVDRATDITLKEEILDSIQENFDNLRGDVEVFVSKGSEVSLEAVKAELENLRESMANSLVPGGAGIDREEIIKALSDGLEGLRADIERPKDSNESILSGTGEILDALHDGLTGLRAEVEKIGSKPVDMTVNYEILDTLKAGLEGVRADIDRLRENGHGESVYGHGEREIAAITGGAIIAAEVEGLKRNDIENLEVLITQLRIKVEALESMPPPPPQVIPDSLSRDDLANVEEALRNVQASVGDISSRDRSVDEDSIKKEDFEAIETLLRNTKAKIDEMDPEQAVKKEHLDIVEDIIRETRDSLNGLASIVTETSKKEDIDIVEALVRDVITGLEEMKERAGNDAEDVEKVTKTDVEAVEAVCHDLKAQIEQMILSDLAILASKDDVINLGELLKEFKGRIETHAEANAQAFEERQAETVGVGERVTEIKTFLEEFKDAVKEKLEEGNTGIEALGKFLEDMGETISGTAVTENIQEILETLKVEFEKSNAGVVGVKLESDEKFQKTWDKVDEKFNDLMLKYDDVQIAAEAKAKAGEERDAEKEAAMLDTKAVAEELKILIDTLGTTLTGSVDKMDEASKTVFSRVDDTFNRVEETHADAKAEHQLTREQVFKALNAVEGVHGQVSEYHPKILDSLKDVLLLVGQHYEHSKTSSDNLQEKIAERAAPPSPILSQAMLQERPVTPPVVEKYDDGQVHEKLDKLVDHMQSAGKSFAQLDMLDKIHQQVMDTAAEVSQFVSSQTQRIAMDHEDKEKAAEEAAILLEKRLAQKDHVEAEVFNLRSEEDRLKDSVSILKAEKEDLSHQKLRLSADVSSLETALRIRREELQAMEARAEGLERRILEGVIDHSRAFLMGKSSNKGRDPMNLKRVPSHATSTGSVLNPSTPRSKANNTTQSAIGMAICGNRAIGNNSAKNTPGGTSKRIFSLNQITNNVPNGGFKRSHSVKQPGGSGALRKSSWGGNLSRDYGDLNKENLALKESEEDSEGGEAGDGMSDAGTMRRTSRGTIITGTDVSGSIDERTEYSEYDGYEDSEISGQDENAHMVLFDEASQPA